MDFIKVIFRMLLEGGWIKHRGLFLWLGLASCIVVGWFDYITTDQINLTFFYLIPIFFTTLAAGRAGGLGMAAACAIIKIVTDVYSEQPYARSIIYAFNGLGLFAAFAAFSLLLDTLRAAYRRECDIYRKDGLTGLPNRQDFFAVVGDAWTLGRDSQTPVTMLVLDLDNFKAFNAASGYHMGDLALQAVARSADKLLAPGDKAYRLGSDDFVVVGAWKDLSEAREAAERLQKGIADALRTKSCPLGVSVCIVSCQHFSIALDEMLLRASAALHAAKQENGAAIVMELRCPAD